MQILYTAFELLIAPMHCNGWWQGEIYWQHTWSAAKREIYNLVDINSIATMLCPKCISNSYAYVRTHTQLRIGQITSAYECDFARTYADVFWPILNCV